MSNPAKSWPLTSACARPNSVKFEFHCPCIRALAFHSVCPWRTKYSCFGRVSWRFGHRLGHGDRERTARRPGCSAVEQEYAEMSGGRTWIDAKNAARQGLVKRNVLSTQDRRREYAGWCLNDVLEPGARSGGGDIELDLISDAAKGKIVRPFHLPVRRSKFLLTTHAGRCNYYSVLLEFIRREVRGMNKLLFVTANPAGTPWLRLDDEFRSIMTQPSNRLDIVARSNAKPLPAARPEDLDNALRDSRPEIVHICGHFDRKGRLLMHDNDGHRKAIDPPSLAAMFAAVENHVRLVFLNGCNARVAADSISDSVECIVTAVDLIDDPVATTFAAAFYRAISSGDTVQEAYEFATARSRAQSRTRNGLICPIGIGGRPCRDHTTDRAGFG